MKPYSFLVVTGLIAFLAGCGGTPQKAATASGPPANVAGSWRGGTIGAGGTNATLMLKQSGSTVTGSIQVAGRPDVTGPLTGTVTGNTIAFKLTSGYGSTGELNVSGDTMTGVVGGAGVRLQRN